MTDTVLFTLGTPFGSWLPTASALLDRAAGRAELRLPAFGEWHQRVVGDAPTHAPAEKASALGAEQRSTLAALAPAGQATWGGLDLRACWTLEALAEQFPQARFLIFIESPAEALAVWLARGGQGEAKAALACWRAGAQRILDHAQRHLSRCLLVDAGEARSQPGALARLCSERLGIGFDAGAPAALAASDALGMAVGMALAAPDRPAQALYAELQASCALLEGTAAGEGLLGLPASVDAGAVVRGLRELRDGGGKEELARAQREAAGAKQEADLLLVQLHQVQEELEHYYLELQKLGSGGGGAAEELPFAFERLDFGIDRDTPPHRELAMELRGVQLGERRFERLELRLVEHHRRPGLALFATDGQLWPISSWQESGREGERPYLLLIPSDGGSVPHFRRMPRADWLLVQGVVGLIGRALGANEGDAAARWRSAADRLRAQLAELPRRFRYDELRVACAGAPGAPVVPGALEVCFGRTLFGSRRFDRVRLRWQPGQAAPLELLGPEDDRAAPPLGTWPALDDGAWATRWPVPVGTALAAADKRRVWAGLPPVDRELLLAVLDALPAAAGSVAESDLPPGMDRAALASAAAALLRDAQLALGAGRVRRVWRAWRGQALPAA